MERFIILEDEIKARGHIMMIEKREFLSVNIAVMTVSDTRTEFDDKSGALLTKLLQEAGHTLVDKIIVPDEKMEISKKLRIWIDNPKIDVIISTGGTSIWITFL